MTGLSVVNSESKSRSDSPCGCSVVGLQPIQIHHVDEANLQVGELLAQDRNRRQRFLRQDIAGAGHHHVRLRAAIVAGPLPDADAFCAVNDRRIHVEINQVRLLVRNDDIDVVLAAQAMVRHAQQAVRIGRKIDARDFRALVADHDPEIRDPRA